MQEILEKLGEITGGISDAFYTYGIIIILLLGGLYFTFRTRFVQFRLLREQFRAVTEKPKDGKGVSSFQALMVSTASRVGTGNIIGVSTALCIGGFGSVLWMWVVAILGASSAFIESTLAQIFKKRGAEGSFGGPSHYIESALKSRKLAVAFSVMLIITYGLGFNMLASFNLQDTFSGYAFYTKSDYTAWIIGFIVAALVAVCLMGGGKWIVKSTSFLVPIMGVAYLLVAMIIVVLNGSLLPDIFAKIFSEAFDLKAIFGGFGGSCVMYGIKRGLFSNEAGVGSAPNASASAEVNHPVKQGLVQVLSVFIDTIVICTATAFMCMCSGVMPSEDIAGAKYVQMSMTATMGKAGPMFITAAMVLFAFTTLLGNIYYVQQCTRHILKKEPSKTTWAIINIVLSLLIFVGAGLESGLLWNIADITMGLMVIINMPVIIILGKYAFRALRDYEKQEKQGKEPQFKAADINLPYKTDYWN